MNIEDKKAYAKAYYESHKADVLAAHRIWKEAHKEEIAANAKIYRESHKAEIKAYYESHRTEIANTQKAYNESHRKEILANKKAYYIANRIDVLAYKKVHYLSHKDERREYLEARSAEISEYNKNYNRSHADDKKAYYIAHKSEVLAATRAYQESHKAETAVTKQAYYDSHRKAKCKLCGRQSVVVDLTGWGGEFCSRGCANKWRSGPNSPSWRGGISFEPYCPKFNTSLKEDVRTKFGRRCFLSGTEENGRRLSVHHCDYLKSQGCRGQRWSLLPLDHGWHMKTNFNRWYWFALLRDYWVYKYLTFHGMDIFDGPDRSVWLWEMYDGLWDQSAAT